MADRNASTEIHSEARGPHWVAWVRGTDGKPLNSVVLVGRSRKEAEERARIWVQANAAG